MNPHLAPAHQPGDRCDVVAHQRRVLGDLPHRLREHIPVDVEAVGVERVGANVLGCPDEERVVDVERLADEWQQASHRNRGEHSIHGPVSGRLSVILHLSRLYPLLCFPYTAGAYRSTPTADTAGTARYAASLVRMSRASAGLCRVSASAAPSSAVRIASS